MASKILLVVATLAGVTNALNDSKEQVVSATELKNALESLWRMERPLVEDGAGRAPPHRASLLRTGSRISKAVAFPEDGAEMQNAQQVPWASDFEKDVSELVTGLAGSSLAGTPLMGEAIGKIKFLITDPVDGMMGKVMDAHAENQKSLDDILNKTEGCSDTKTEELAAASAFNVTYRAQSALHKKCRTEEASFYEKQLACHSEWHDKHESVIDKCDIYIQMIEKYADEDKNKKVMTRVAQETSDVYLSDVTDAICGTALNCEATGCSGDDLAGAGDSASYVWLKGPSGNGYLDQFMKAKKECNEATVAFKASLASMDPSKRSEHVRGITKPTAGLMQLDATPATEDVVTRCADLDTQWADKRSSCDTTQDEMDSASCQWAVGTKDACEKYEVCYTTNKETHGELVESITGEETDRKVEWNALKRMLCILDAFGTGNLTVDKLNICRATTHNTTLLDIQYPTLPAQVDCLTPTTYPATADYKKAEFVPLPAAAKGKMDANECSGLKDVSTLPRNATTVPNCTCTRMTMAGPYKAGPIVKCQNCKDIFKSEDESSCPSGTKLFAPRDHDDWSTFISSLVAEPLRDPDWIIDITRPQDGCIEGNCTLPMNSHDSGVDTIPVSARWKTADGHPWWLSGNSVAHNLTSDEGLSGDYRANCFLEIVGNLTSADRVTFKDVGNCAAHSKSYYCQPDDNAHPPKAGSPSSCNCKKVDLTGAYSAGILVKCEKCLDVYKSTQTNSCPDGMKIFSPASHEDWKTVLESVGSDGLGTGIGSPHWIVDVTRAADGCPSGGCTEYAMNSNVPQNGEWSTSDGSPWFLKAEPYDAPSAEYKANCYLNLKRDTANKEDLFFNSNACNVHSSSYYCQPEVTTTTTTTTQATCGTFKCPTNHLLNQDKLEELNPNKDLCCEATCAAHTCQMNWQHKASINISTTVGSDDATCCEATCAAHTCSLNWLPKANITPAATVGNTDAMCCEATCAAHTCSQKLRPKSTITPVATVGNTDAMCCEAIPVNEVGTGVACSKWEEVAVCSEAQAKIPSGTKTSPLHLYRMSNADKTSSLYIKDPGPQFDNIHFWRSNGRDSVMCATSASPNWVSVGAQYFSCDAFGVGNHQCGTQNGWILWHNGATYGNGPCNVAGYTSYDHKELIYLDRCMS